MNAPAPPDWKALDDFAAGIDGNRLPRTDLLAGTSLVVIEQGRSPLRLDFRTGDEVSWRRDSDSPPPSALRAAGGKAHPPPSEGTDWYEAVEVRPDMHYLTFTDATCPLRACVLMVNRATGRTLTVSSVIADEPTPGKPQVCQHFRPGVIEDAVLSGDPPAPTRDLIGLRALYRYSPNHLYEHVYLSSERYAWQCLVGEQRGHGDVDLATAWKLADDLYVFTFREFLIPVAATWLYDMEALRTTGTFVGLGADGSVMVAPGGAFITPLGRVTYPDDQPI